MGQLAFCQNYKDSNTVWVMWAIFNQWTALKSKVVWHSLLKVSYHFIIFDGVISIQRLSFSWTLSSIQRVYTKGNTVSMLAHCRLVKDSRWCQHVWNANRQETTSLLTEQSLITPSCWRCLERRHGMMSSSNLERTSKGQALLPTRSMLNMMPGIFLPACDPHPFTREPTWKLSRPLLTILAVSISTRLIYSCTKMSDERISTKRHTGRLRPKRPDHWEISTFKYSRILSYKDDCDF